MKASSIVTIREMLIAEQEKSEEAYKMFKQAMIDKYKTDWINYEMNDSEKKLLESLRVRWNDMNDVLEDFENYQW